MKKFLLVLLLLPIIAVAVLWLAFVNVNRILDSRRGELEALASEAAGRQVTFQNAEVAFPGRLSIQIDDLTVSEDPAFGEGEFLALDTGYISIDLLPALQRRIEINGIRLDSPKIQVIQTKRGYNFSTLGAKEEASGEAAAGGGEESAPMALAIAGFLINDATILYEDRTSSPAVSLTIENFDSRASDIFGKEREGPVEIAFTGRARPTKGSPELASDLEGEIVMTDLAAAEGNVRLKSPSLHPKLLGFDFDEGGPVERLDDFDLKVKLPRNADANGYPIEVVSSAGRLAGFDFNKLNTALVYRGKKLDVNQLVVGLIGGQVDLSGDMTFGPAGRAPFNFKTKLTSLDADALAHKFAGTPKGSISGAIGGDVNLSGKSLDWNTLKRSMAGQIDLQVGEGALEGVNVLDKIVGRLVQDPVLGQMAADAIRDVIPEALQGERTVFENINMAMGIADGAIQADQLDLMAGNFLIQAAGALGLDGAVSADGKLRFPEEISQKIYAKAGKFAPLLGDGTIVELPLLVGGNIASPSIRPDVASLTALARSNATAEIRTEAGDRLRKAIFGDNVEPPDSATKGDPEKAQKANQQDAAKQLIEQGLGKLFGN